MSHALLVVMREETRNAANPSVPYGKGIRVGKTITINASPEELYRFWCESIHAESDVEVINEIPNELIGWRSREGSRVDNAGSVHFTPTDRGTEVKIELLYDPPAGRIGAAIAKLFGEDPATQIEEDLHRFKTIVETRR